MWVKNEKSWILGIDITSMQQSNDLCFTELELVFTAAAQTYEGVLILNLHLFLLGCVSPHRSRQAAWWIWIWFSVRLIYLQMFLMSLCASRFLFRRSPFDTVGHHYTRNALIIDAPWYILFSRGNSLWGGEILRVFLINIVKSWKSVLTFPMASTTTTGSGKWRERHFIADRRS